MKDKKNVLSNEGEEKQNTHTNNFPKQYFPHDHRQFRRYKT